MRSSVASSRTIARISDARERRGRFAPRALAGEGDEVRAGNMMVMADFAAPQPREVRLGPICRCAIVLHGSYDTHRVNHSVEFVSDVPSGRFVGMENGPGRDPSADCWDCRTLAFNHDRDSAAIALADDDNDLALAGSLLR
jgi:hypothetical protein